MAYGLLVGPQKLKIYGLNEVKIPKSVHHFHPSKLHKCALAYDVILQHPFKHAFKKEFHSWTCSIIKSQLERSEIVKVDFWMSILKPNICAWLFQAWIHVKNMSKIISECWEKMGLLRSFNMEFQLQAMEVNTATPLFSITFNLKRKHQEKEDDHDLDPKIPLLKSCRIV
jgi:hypothetical protein